MRPGLVRFYILGHSIRIHSRSHCPSADTRVYHVPGGGPERALRRRAINPAGSESSGMILGIVSGLVGFLLLLLISLVSGLVVLSFDVNLPDILNQLLGGGM